MAESCGSATKRAGAEGEFQGFSRVHFRRIGYYCTHAAAPALADASSFLFRADLWDRGQAGQEQRLPPLHRPRRRQRVRPPRRPQLQGRECPLQLALPDTGGFPNLPTCTHESCCQPPPESPCNLCLAPPLSAAPVFFPPFSLPRTFPDTPPFPNRLAKIVLLSRSDQE